MAFSQQPRLTSPQWPLAIRPESITMADPETTITVRNRPEPWHPLDYIVTDQNGATLFTVHGHPWGLTQRRVFCDASGLPLFELRSRWYDSLSLVLKLPGAGPSSESLLSAKCRVAVQAPRAVLCFRNAFASSSATYTYRYQHMESHSHTRVPSTGHDNETVMEVLALDVDNLLQVAVVENQRIACFERITDLGVLAQGQKPPFRFRPMWRVRVARGVDLALIAVAVVIVGQQVSEAGLADG
ncbi:hypothetical protein BJX61DRAFT_280720 [Aspergillus egyptiacus]|nr:hypothetical protein BJX61DRAFT_280720 [Aspergillus egyptiacus]